MTLIFFELPGSQKKNESSHCILFLLSMQRKEIKQSFQFFKDIPHLELNIDQG